MPKVSRKILVKDLIPGDVVETTVRIRVNGIKKLNSSVPTVSKGILVIQGVPVDGGWRDKPGEFVINEGETLKLVKRVNNKPGILKRTCNWMSSLFSCALMLMFFV